jgi:N-acetyl-anhydromuramyl-L-alanine amidase AmpD
MRAPDHSPLDDLSFAGLRSTRPRVGRVRKIVIHTSGGIRPIAGLYETLRSRTGPKTPDGLSAHYLGGVDGAIVQTAPHNLVCLHAGKANDDSVGLEFVCPLYDGKTAAKERARGVRRGIYRDAPRGGKVVRLVDLTPEQTAAMIELVEQLCDLLRIPRRVPLDAKGLLLRRAMTEAELDAYEGVLGHFHVPTAPVVKLDPGTRPLDRLRHRWA